MVSTMDTERPQKYKIYRRSFPSSSYISFNTGSIVEGNRLPRPRVPPAFPQECPSLPSAAMLYGLLPSALRFLVTSLLWKEEYLRPPANSLTFELRHEHAVTNGSLLVFSDVPKFRQLAGEDDRLQYTVKTKGTRSHVFTRSLNSWDDVEVPGPNVTDRETLHTLATMTNNAYYQDLDRKGWYDLGPDWNSVRVCEPLFALC